MHLHHISDSNLCNVDEIVEIKDSRRIPRPVPVFIFAATIQDQSVRQHSCLEAERTHEPSVFANTRVLRDTGASRNFVSSSLMSRLALPTLDGSSPLRVRLADGTIKVSDKVAKLKVNLPGFVYTGYFQVLDMGTSDVDIIWGTPWEATMGDVTSNYSSGLLSFLHWGRKTAQTVTLRSELHRHVDDKLNFIDDRQAIRDMHANRRICGNPKGFLTYIHMNNSPPT